MPDTIRARRKKERPDEYLAGIPNRDLAEEEYQALDTDQRRLVRDSGLWDVKTDAEMKADAQPAARQEVTDAG